ncbi:MAG TPA: NAD(P)/FAD-dependent oxidoreductase [Candidatus Angelobacter sp.]|nr:NAD(P)/FAD-dependent oxidoreductase [Candidatus Angelobacter sp.]
MHSAKSESNEQRVSVLVVGGGPGGSTAAALLAKAGIDVLLLERETFPRYHIGESLLASCLPTLRLSGAFEKVAAHGFQRKRGALFHWAEDIWVLDWAKLIDPDAWSWQVERADYDNILLRNAEEQGARVIENAAVKRVIFEGDRAVAVEWVRRGQESQLNTTRFDYIIDASGRTGVLGQQHFKMRNQHAIFQNIAIWGYWQGAKLLPQSPSGGINVVSSPDGWWWHIPLGNERYSIGLVTHKLKYAQDKPKSASLKEYYLNHLNESDSMKKVVEGAELTSDIQAEQDYSYVSDRFCGPGFFLVGDAACFLDPLLSTGVHLAQYSAMLAAASIISTRKKDVTEDEGYKFYEYIYRRAYTRMLVLVSTLYQKYNGKDDYFWGAQKLVHEKMRQVEPVRAFTEIIAGNIDMHEAKSVETRALDRQLLDEAEEAQEAKAAEEGSHGLHSMDVTATWGPWRSLVGADTSVGEFYLVTEPELGLRKAQSAVAAR